MTLCCRDGGASRNGRGLTGWSGTCLCVQIDMRGNQLRNEAALRVIRALHVLQKRATKLGRNVTGAYPTCELHSRR